MSTTMTRPSKQTTKQTLKKPSITQVEEHQEEAAKPSDELMKEWEEKAFRCHDEIVLSLRMSIPKSIEAGEFFSRIKKALGHGNWLPWIDERRGKISRATANRYMNAYKWKDKLLSLSNLSEFYRWLYSDKKEEGDDEDEDKKDEKFPVDLKFTKDQDKEYTWLLNYLMGKFKCEIAEETVLRAMRDSYKQHGGVDA